MTFSYLSNSRQFHKVFVELKKLIRRECMRRTQKNDVASHVTAKLCASAGFPLSSLRVSYKQGKFDKCGSVSP